MSAISRVLFLGSKQLGLRVLREVHSLSPATLIGAVTIDDSSDTRTKFSDFQVFAKSHQVELSVASNRKHSEQIINELKPDLCLVVGWYWLISKPVLDSVPFGFVGLHTSLLPKFRGGSPLVWSIIKDEREVGFSFYSFTAGMDDGPIWARASVSVDEHDYISSILNKLEIKAIEVLRQIYPQLLSCSIEPIEQNHELATYYTRRFPSHGNINWHEPARAVYNFIRAQSEPYPGAFTHFQGEKLTVWRAALSRDNCIGQPGQVARRASEGVYIICGDDRAIILEEIQLGGKRGKAGDFIKSVKGRMSNVSMER
jgi:methionyl-tRNA formyltransferase